MATLKLNRAQVALQPQQLVLKRVQKYVGEVLVGAKAIAGTGKYAIGGTAARIRADWRITTYDIRVRIGPKPRHKGDLAAHQGARRHTIRAKRGRTLRFFWRKKGRYVYFRSVNHPGMKGKQYLVKPLKQFGRRNGFRVITVPKVR